MVYLIPALILLFCAPAFFVDARLMKSIAILAGIALAVGAAALAWASLIPANFLVEHPALANSPLHPTVATVLGGILVLYSLGLGLALGTRLLYRYLRIIKS